MGSGIRLFGPRDTNRHILTENIKGKSPYHKKKPIPISRLTKGSRLEEKRTLISGPTNPMEGEVREKSVSGSPSCKIRSKVKEEPTEKKDPRPCFRGRGNVSGQTIGEQCMKDCYGLCKRRQVTEMPSKTKASKEEGKCVG